MFDLSSLIDLLTTGNKARVGMEAAIAKGYVEDEEAMRTYYENNQEVLEGWFRYADVETVIQDIRSEGNNEGGSGGSDTVPLSVAGAAAGALITYTFTE